MRILLLLFLLGCYPLCHGSLAKPIEEKKTLANVFAGTDEQLLKKQTMLASQLEDASSTLKTILEMDFEGRVTKDLGPLEAKLACALGVVKTGIETSMANTHEDASSEFACNSSPKPIHVKRKPSRRINDLVSVCSNLTSDTQAEPPQCTTLPMPPKKIQSHLMSSKNVAFLKVSLDKLTQDLGQEFMEVFYVWYVSYRMRLSTRAATQSVPFQNLLLQCALETSALTAEAINKERRKRRSVLPELVIRDNPNYARPLVTWRALSTILASGLCELSAWQLSDSHTWAQQVFTLVHDARVQSALRHNKMGLAKGLYHALSQPKLKLDTRVDLFMYLIDPESAAKKYAQELSATKKVVASESEGEKERDSKKQTPVIWAVMYDHVNALLAILQGYKGDSSSEDSCEHNDTDESSGDTQQSDTLDEKDGLLGAIDAEDYKECAAIDYACLFTRTTCLELLLNAGSVLPRVQTLLTLVEKENVESLKALLEHMVMPDEVVEAAREKKKRSVIELFENHRPQKAGASELVIHKKGRRKNRAPRHKK